MEKIILYTHLHNNLPALIDFGLQLANDMAKSLQILNVIDSRSMSYVAGSVEPMMESGNMINYDLLNKEKESAEKSLQDILSNRKKVNKVSVSVDVEVTIDNPEWVLTRLSKEDDTYLILLPEVKNDAIGEAYEQYKHLLNDLYCPILLIPDNVVYHTMQKIVVTTDYKEEDISILKKLENVARNYKSKVLVLHVNDEEAFEYELKEKGFEHTLSEKVDYPDVDFKAIEDEQAEEAISRFSERVHADLLVLHKEQRNIFQKLFSKSKTRRIIEKVHMPVLVYNDHTLSMAT